MKLKKLVVPFFGLLFLACSSDDSDDISSMETELAVADFIVIGEDLESVYQYSFEGSDETGEQINLTTQLNITPNYLTLREVDDLLSFYYFADGAFSIILNDVRTGATATYTDFFMNSPERSIAWGINSESNVVFGFFGPSGTRDFGVQDFDLQTFIGVDTAIDEDIDFVFQPRLLNDKAYFIYRDNVGIYKFSFYDLEEKNNGPILDFSDVPVSFLFTEAGEVAIIKNGTSPSIETYNPDTLVLMEVQPLQFNTAFSAGPVEGAVLDDSYLYYVLPNVQPARFAASPAIFDLNSQENVVLDLFAIVNEVERELGLGIELTTQIYDSSQDIFLIGYGTLGDTSDGGVLQISTSGELIANIELPFFPSYFVRN